MSGLARFGAIGRALTNRNFGIYTAGNTPSVIGVWVQRVAVGWLTWELTESGTWLGAMGFADLFPIFLLSPLAGLLADRFDRLAIAKVVQLIAAAQAVTLTVLAYSGLITVELLLGLTFIAGIDQAFYQPVRQALAPNLVRREDLPAAIAINSIVWNTARFIGPAIAGVILVTSQAATAFAFNAVTYAFFLVALWRIRIRPDPLSERSVGLGGALTEGYRYAFTHPAIAPSMLILAAAALFARPVVELLPGFAAEVFGRGADGLAWLTSAMGVGAMAAGVWLGQRGRIAGLPVIAIHTLLLAGGLLVLFTTTSSFAVAVLSMAGIGFMQVVVGTSIQTIVQTVAEATMRGRVLALYGMVWMGGAAIGAVAMGSLSEWFGLRAPVAGGAVLCLLVWLWGVRIRRRLAQAAGAEG